MLGSDMLEVAIGLGLTFALLSLIASGVRESIEAVAQTRAIGLERGLRELLDDGVGTGTTRELYAHPLIAGLFRGYYDPGTLIGAGAKRRVRLGTRLPAYLPGRSVALALLDLTAGQQIALHPATVRAGLEQVASPALRGAVAVALDEARGDLDRLVAEVERWFDSAMERAGGWYRKQTHGLLLAIGLVLAIAGNVDAIALAGALYREPAMRAAIVAEAQAGTGCTEEGCAEQRLAALALPIGWERGTVAPWWRAIPGWLLTAFAVALGAPFWFDLIGRVAMVRSTVRPAGVRVSAPPIGGSPPPQSWAGRADPHEGLL